MQEHCGTEVRGVHEHCGSEVRGVYEHYTFIGQR